MTCSLLHQIMQASSKITLNYTLDDWKCVGRNKAAAEQGDFGPTKGTELSFGTLSDQGDFGPFKGTKLSFGTLSYEDEDIASEVIDPFHPANFNFTLGRACKSGSALSQNVVYHASGTETVSQRSESDMVSQAQYKSCRYGYACNSILSTCKFWHSKQEIEYAEKCNGNGTGICDRNAFCCFLHQGKCWFVHPPSQRKAAKQARKDGIAPCPEQFKCSFYSRGVCKHRSRTYWHANSV